MAHEFVPMELRDDWCVAVNIYIAAIEVWREYPDVLPRAHRRLYQVERRIAEWRSGQTYQSRWKWKGKHLDTSARESIGSL